MKKITFLFLFVTVIIKAQVTSPTTQPLYGPGGKNYPCQSFDSAFYGSDLTNWYYIYEPDDPRPDSACVIVYWHGSSSTMDYHDSAMQLSIYFEHLTKKGYIVIVPVWEYGGGQLSSLQCAELLQTAFSALDSSTHVHPKRNASGKILYGMIGYSLGGGVAFDIANNYNEYGLDPPSSVCSESGIGPFGGSLSNILPSTKIVCISGESDESVPFATEKSIFDGLTSVPCSNKNLIELINDYHGTPSLVATHLMYLTGTDTANRSMINAFTWYGVWKYSVAIMDCGMKGTNCRYVLGYNDSIIFMGNWSDSFPVHYPDVIEPCSRTGNTVINPPAGTYYNPVKVTMSSPDRSAGIFYTTDGSIPWPESDLYTDTITIASNVSVMARTYSGTDTAPGITDTSVYKIIVGPPMVQVVRLADGQTVVVLKSLTDKDSIYFTTNHASPVKTISELYTDSFIVSGSVTIKAKAYKGTKYSTVTDTSFTVSSITGNYAGIVDISPVPFSNRLKILLNAPSDNYIINIISADGRLIYTSNLPSGDNNDIYINTGDWASGVYIVSITGNCRNSSIIRIVK